MNFWQKIVSVGELVSYYGTFSNDFQDMIKVDSRAHGWIVSDLIDKFWKEDDNVPDLKTY